MRPYYQTPDVTIYHGDCRQVLAELPAESVQVCCSSPPYFGLRAYKGVAPSVWGGDAACEHEWGEERFKTSTADTASGIAGTPRKGNDFTASQGQFCRRCNAWLGCLGLEPTPELFIAHLVEVFRGVKRALRRDGTLWVNLGSSYSGSGKGPMGNIPSKAWNNDDAPRGTSAPGVPPKSDLCIPDRFRLAMLADGWIVRVRSVPWIKRSCMPGSQTDRPTIATEDWMMFTKSGKYFWDAEAVKRTNSQGAVERFGKNPKRSIDNLKYAGMDGIAAASASARHPEWLPNGRALRTTDAYFDSLDLAITETRRTLAHLERVREQGGLLLDDDGEPLALDVVSAGSDREHYASYPEAIVRPFVLAGTSEYGCCATCQKPYERIVERETIRQQLKAEGKSFTGTKNFEIERLGFRNSALSVGGGSPDTTKVTTLGWAKACTCPTDERTAGVILDPFLGSGTTAVVARQLGRRAIGIDASADYCAMARDRIEETTPHLPIVEESAPQPEQLGLEV